MEKFALPHLRAWREFRDVSQTELAEHIGRVPAVISRVERGLQPLSEPLVAKAAAFLETTPDALQNTPPEGDPPRVLRRRARTKPALPVQEQLPVPGRDRMPLDLPLRGTAAGSFSGAFQIDDIVDYIRRPPGLSMAKQAYAIQVIGESMVPRFEPGEMVFVHPGRVPVPGDDVILTIQEGPNAEPETFIKRLVSQSGDKVVVSRFNPPQQITWKRAYVQMLHRVSRNSDLYGSG